jgi:nucleotidyltransferase/DNA polymerase involved in DNA repair
MPAYKIEDIEGIGASHGAKLRKNGVKSVGMLLKKGCDRKGRKKLSEATGIDDSLILKWVNKADLCRVRGVGSEYAELLEKAGVDTVKELRNRNPKNLYEKMAEVNSAGGRPLVRQLPGKKRVESWVSHAKELEPVLTY